MSPKFRPLQQDFTLLHFLQQHFCVFFTLTLRKRVWLDGVQEEVDEDLDGLWAAAHRVEVDGLSEVCRCGSLAVRVLGGWLGRDETQQQGYCTGPQPSAMDAHRACGHRGRPERNRLDNEDSELEHHHTAPSLTRLEGEEAREDETLV